ncbi:transforming growth factor beta activator LRRC33 [Hyla sarda]|uniref:transforming growth factor beta activator LRRC33 n=1 Tax=Hyla sarda TaxID=327740 RepID=UPI0024C412E3|nr:transforming growth factor beta activator LRRC33 [Hyla sarda]XP_056420386.1 transforming growth factor beta activator LRRC33 [Hyla sarda]XP_056420387.1 transforming growth factor beta activator LRRC33 [Hyla sarda]XP_056420389.1 transforming growth factor beta activator LRRC33 [Hyla sarda]XP_056420390.1 transforming growth factor beta activator LRRC33 [Hyla sarda]
MAILSFWCLLMCMYIVLHWRNIADGAQHFSPSGCRIVSKVAHCRYLQLTSIPQDLPSDIKELIIDHNNVKSLQEDALQRYPDLNNLSLKSNNLGYLDWNIFEGTSKQESPLPEENTIFMKYTLVSLGLRSAVSLRWLDLSRNSLNEDMVQTLLTNLTTLEYLNLDYNIIMRLDRFSFEGLRNLKELSLQRNYIYEIGAGTFDSLVNLRTLNMAFNLLPCIVDFGATQLQVLNLSHNHIEWFFSREVDLDFQLQKLDISHNQLLFFPFLPKKHHLRTLLLSDNKMKFYSKHFDKNSSFADFLIFENNRSNITTVYLWSDFIPSDLSTLNILDISKNQFDYLPDDFLSAMSSMSSLKLNWNCLETFDLANKQITSNLTFLDLSNNKLSGLSLEESRSNLHQLGYLNLSQNRLQEIPRQIFTTMTSLSTLDLSHNLISLCSPTNTDDYQDCVDLRNIPSLQHLRLSDCGLKLDKQAIFHGTTLRHVDVSYNQVKSLEFLQDTVKMLKSLSLRNCLHFVDNIDFSHFKSLTSLDISENNLTTFPNSLLDLTLQYLDIHENKLTLIPIYSSHQPLFRSLNTIYLSRNSFDCCKLNWYDILTKSNGIKIPDLEQTTCNFSSNYISVQELPEPVGHSCHWRNGGTFIILVFSLPTCVTLLVAFILLFLLFKEPLLKKFKKHFRTSPSY